MTMYMEDRSNNRERWCYEYTGEELLPVAKAKYKEVLGKEKEARQRMAKMMTDMRINAANDPGVQDCKEDISKYGMLREQCAVFIHQFEREKPRRFSLAMGDVVFFGLVNENLEA
jgi:hypothetical protein